MRYVGDYNVDRSQVYAQQCVQPSDTNMSIALIFLFFPLSHFLKFKRVRVFKDGGYSGKVTPVPIPNTEVKLTHADGTVPATEWQSRSPPSLNTNTLLFIQGSINTEPAFLLLILLIYS